MVTYHKYYEKRNKELLEKNKQLSEKVKKLKKKVSYDDLTHLLRRDKFDEILENLIKRSDRINAPLSYILVDIDNFKKINDIYGHNKGDEILQEVASTLTKTVRDSDILCRDFVGRYGGEEMSVFLTNTDKAGAMIVGERIRKAIENKFKNSNIKVTISAGISTYIPKSKKDIKTISKEADENLYKAKKKGKNRVVY